MLIRPGAISTVLRASAAAFIISIVCYLWVTLPPHRLTYSGTTTSIVIAEHKVEVDPDQIEEGINNLIQAPASINSGNDVRNASGIMQANNSCTQPRTHFMFSKIEKTGSSTLYGMFQRFVKMNKLNLMVQTQGYHMNTSAPRGAHPGWDIGPRHDELADVWIDHGAFNNSLVRHHMHADTILIACVREPISWFKSATKYFDHTRRFSPDQLINNDKEVFRDRLEISTYLHLNQLLWLGLDYSKHDDVDYIKSYVDFLVKRFSVIMLTDQFDASVVILRRRMCWSYSDIFYKSNIVTGGGKRSTMTDENKQKLLSARVNLGEKILYDKFNETWWRQPETKDPAFWEEVQYFVKTNKEVQGKCRRTGTFTVPASKYHEILTMTSEACKLMHMSPIPMYVSTARYAIGKSYISW